MNYFSHFVVDHRPGNYAFNTGLILPDLTKKWIRTFRDPEPGAHFTSGHLDLLAGCLKHYESDRQFHGSVFFSKYHHLLNEEMKTIGFSDAVERKWFISHIMLELLVDRVLVRSYRYLLDDFYTSLMKVDDDLLRSFLTFYGMKNDGEFFGFFGHFRSVQYIYFYTDNNRFIYSLNRIMMRAKVKELAEPDQVKLETLLLSFEEKYFSSAPVMLDELKAVFK